MYMNIYSQSLAEKKVAPAEIQSPKANISQYLLWETY